MCDVVNKIMDKGIQIGKQEGEERLAKLCTLLARQNRDKEMYQCFTDRNLRNNLYKEYGL